MQTDLYPASVCDAHFRASMEPPIRVSVAGMVYVSLFGRFASS
jgi:hypothetical protein